MSLCTAERGVEHEGVRDELGAFLAPAAPAASASDAAASDAAASDDVASALVLLGALADRSPFGFATCDHAVVPVARERGTRANAIEEGLHLVAAGALQRGRTFVDALLQRRR